MVDIFPLMVSHCSWFGAPLMAALNPSSHALNSETVIFFSMDGGATGVAPSGLCWLHGVCEFFRR